MSKRLSAREALARAFPGYGPEMYNTEMADRVIVWLDHCGYEIVAKHQVSLVPPDPVDADALRKHADLRHEQALT